MKKPLIALFALATFLALPALADEGRRPISKAGTITAPGTYVVTRDISSTNDPIIRIQANDVKLDLNGHTISNPSGTNVLIKIDHGFSRIAIMNGRLVSQGTGITDGGDSCSSSARSLIRLENLDFSGSNYYNSVLFRCPDYLEVVSCNFLKGNLHTNPNQTGKCVIPRIVNNTFYEGSTLDVRQTCGGEIRGNHCVRIDTPTNPGNGIGILIIGQGTLIEGNTVTGEVFGPYASGINTEGDGFTVRNNTVRRVTTGIQVRGLGQSVHDNTVSGCTNGIRCGLTTAWGIGSSYAFLEGNHVTENSGCGILFEDGGTNPTATIGNAYRNNMLRNNAGGAVCGDAGRATDEGGNIL